jgi:aspartyl-tRNA(Asn)/glutamyl-tRNA(Gln) amidotransferase subunit C
MPVSLDDVRHVAALARLSLDEARARTVVVQLNTILEHMAVLSTVDTNGVEAVGGVGAAGTPLRDDLGPAAPLARPLTDVAPRMQEGFFLVPRLSTHEDPESAA